MEYVYYIGIIIIVAIDTYEYSINKRAIIDIMWLYTLVSLLFVALWVYTYKLTIFFIIINAVLGYLLGRFMYTKTKTLTRT